MAQVRKLQKGNSIPKAETEYKFTLDGNTYNVTDEQLSEIDEGLSKLDPNLRQFLGNWTNAIRSGDMSGNTVDSTVSRDMISNLEGKNLKRWLSQKPSNWESIAQTPSYFAKIATNEALGVTKRVLNKQSTTNGSENKAKIGTDSISIDFNTDADGRRYLSPTEWRPQNRVTQILEHLEKGDNSPYDVTGWDFTGINNWLNGLGDGNKYELGRNYFKNLWASMKPGFDEAEGYNGQDLSDLLALFNINLNDSTAGVIDNSKSKTQRDLEKDFPGLYEFVGDNVTKDKYGIWRLNPGATFDFGIPELTGKNIYFNDDFYNSRYAAGKHLDALRGLTFYDNAFYRKDSPELAQILNAEGFYNDMMRRGDWTSANDLIASLFTTGNRELPSAIKDNEYLKFLNRPGDRYASLTGAYTINGENLQPGQQLIQYLNLGEPNSDGPYTTYSYKYALLDANGNPVLDQNGNPMIDIPWDTIQEISGASAKPLRTSGRVVDENSPAYGYVYEDPTGRNNEASGIKIYQDPDSPNKNVILHIPNIKASGVDEGFDLKLPSDLAQILIENKETWLNNVLSNPKYRSQFESLISDLVRARTSQWNVLPFMARNRFKNLGFKDEQLDKIVEAWQKARKSGSRNERRENMLVYAPSFNRNGGKIQYIAKLATGGKSNNNKGSEVKTTKQYTNTKVANPNNAAGALEFSKFRDEDWMDLTALGADLASLGITIADPTNIGGMVSGVGSSLLRYKADKGRQEKGAGKQLAINLAMDAATLLPIIGDAASSAKLINSVRKALPTIIKLASLYGMSEAVVNSAKKIANGDKFTVRDVSIIANAITSGIAIGKSGGFGKSKTSSKVTKDISLTSNDGKSTIKLTSKQVEKISTPDELKAALYKEAKKSNPQLTEAQFEEKFDVSELLTNTTKRSLKKPKTWLKGENVSTFKPEITSVTTPLSVNPQRRFYNWWHGLNRENMVFRGNVNGEQMNVNVPGRIRYRTDIAEAPGTTAGANYYKDEFGTWYRIGDRSSRTATAAELQSASTAPRRQAINNESGFTGKVNVFEGTVNPSTSTHRYPTMGIVMPQYFDWRTNREPQVYQALPGTFKKGGIIKGQEGLSGIDQDYIDSEFEKSWKGILNSIHGGGPTYNKPDLTKHLIPLLSGARFALNSHFQNKYYNQAKAALEAGRYEEIPTILNTPDSSNPALDRALRQNYLMRAAGIKPVTSDWVQHNALSNQRESQLWDREQSLLSQRSQYDHDIKNEILNIENQNLANRIKTANENAAKRAAINSAIKQQALELTQRRGQSWDNLGLEVQNNLNKDRQTMLNYNYALESQRLNKQYDTNLDTLFPGARAKYNTLSPDEAAKYYEFEDYLRRNYGDIYNKNVDTIAGWQEDRANGLRRWMYDNSLNYSYSPLLTGYTSPIGIDRKSLFKKGGTVKGNTRYKYEPDEQIWIDNNKATHQAIAKLSENTIKLLLRALK